jgi:hypothetical protein
MNAMGHNIPTMIGVDHRGIAQKIIKLIPDYMVMGERGMHDMTEMEMPLPDNTAAMMTGAGPFGAVGMGGMFSVVKVRKDQPRGERVHTISGFASTVTELAFHPRKDLLITFDAEGGIALWDYKEGKKTQSIDGRAPLALSADGQQVAFVRHDGAVQRRSFATQREIGEPLPFDVAGGGSDKGKAAGALPRVPDKGIISPSFRHCSCCR